MAISGTEILENGCIMNSDHFISLAVEFWKIINSYERSLVFLPPEHQAKTQAQIRFSAQKLNTLLEDTGVRLVSYEGQVFEPNLPVSAINADEYIDVEDNLVVKQTIEPAVIDGSKVIVMGKVILAKGE